jgi:hypothetical protein
MTGPHSRLHEDGSPGFGVLQIADPSSLPSRFAKPPCPGRAVGMGVRVHDINVLQHHGQAIEVLFLPILSNNMDIYTSKWIIQAACDIM